MSCVCGYENTLLLLLLLLRRPDRPLAVCSGGGGGEGKAHFVSTPSVIVSVGGGNLCFDTAVLSQCRSFCFEED